MGWVQPEQVKPVGWWFIEVSGFNLNPGVAGFQPFDKGCVVFVAAPAKCSGNESPAALRLLHVPTPVVCRPNCTTHPPNPVLAT